jgi:hypothetical protein
MGKRGRRGVLLQTSPVSLILEEWSLHTTYIRLQRGFSQSGRK